MKPGDCDPCLRQWRDITVVVVFEIYRMLKPYDTSTECRRRLSLQLAVCHYIIH